MTTKETLGAAKRRIDKPQKWNRGAGASRDGRRVCAFIAIEDVGVNSSVKAAAVRALCGSAGRLIRFNDSHSHAEVMALFDRAIARAK